MSGGGGSPAPFTSPDPLGAAGSVGAGGGPASGASGGGGPAGGGDIDPCLALRFTARLRSVNPDELAQVQVGDVLLVQVFQADRPQIGAFRIVSADPAPVRAAVPVGVLLDRILELLPCIRRIAYIAVIDDIDGGTVTVTVAASGTE